MANPIGPFETEREALDLPAVRAVFEAFDRDPGPGKMAPHTHKMLISACAAAGVELGGYDRSVILWLSRWEPQTAAVVAGLIGRARAAGSDEGQADGPDPDRPETWPFGEAPVQPLRPDETGGSS